MKLNKAGAILGAAALAFSLFPTNVLAAAGDCTAEESITVTGLDEGDTAKYYQIVEYDTTTQNWKLKGTNPASPWRTSSTALPPRRPASLPPLPPRVHRI